MLWEEFCVLIVHTSALEMTQLSNDLITDNCVIEADVWAISVFSSSEIKLISDFVWD